MASYAGDCPPWANSLAARTLAVTLLVLQARRCAAEDRIEYRYEDYQEDGGRIHVRTQSSYFETDLKPTLTLKGTAGWDGISGATPTGGPPVAGSTQVPLVNLYDNRYSGSLGVDWQAGRWTTSPEFSYSTEKDYESFGAGLNERIDFNQRNTTLALGINHDSDKLNGFWQPDWVHKSTTDGLIGLTQLLSPGTIWQATGTLGYSSGFLTDPYKGVNFSYAYPVSFYDPASSDSNSPEKRPGHRFKQILFTSLTQYIDAVNAAAELSYRFHHDDFGIFDHTVALSWRQKLGRRFTLVPLVRYYWQTAAYFYSTRFEGDPAFPQGVAGAAQSDGFTILFKGVDPGYPGDASSTFNVPAQPRYYSSDYRLSAFQSWTVGASLVFKVTEQWRLDAGFKRYEMHGLDGITSPSAYPKANIATIGASLLF